MARPRIKSDFPPPACPPKPMTLALLSAAIVCGPGRGFHSGIAAVFRPASACRMAVCCCKAAARRSRRRLRTSITAGMDGLQLGDLLFDVRDFFAVVCPAVGVPAAPEVLVVADAQLLAVAVVQRQRLLQGKQGRR